MNGDPADPGRLSAAEVKGLLVVGTLLVDEVLTLALPVVPGSQQRATRRRVTGGGQVWHTALAAARSGAGVRVAVAGRRGADAAGHELAAQLVQAGVVDQLLGVGASRRAVVLDAPPAERAIVSLPEELPGVLPVPDDYATRVLAGVGWVHVDGYALDAVTGDVALGIASAAAGLGAVVPSSLPVPGSVPAPWPGSGRSRCRCRCRCGCRWSRRRCRRWRRASTGCGRCRRWT
jgi:sugar/nucleoside kinase (ribokinase family)